MNIINYLIMTNTLKENSDLTYSLFYKNKDYNNNYIIQRYALRGMTHFPSIKSQSSFQLMLLSYTYTCRKYFS